jgi:hypothetical protein
MRPPSIIMFERLFLASLALSLVGFALSYEVMLEEFAREPGMAELGLGSGFVLGIVAVSYAVYLLLWFLIARRASNVAKWILVVLLALSVISLVGLFAGPWDWMALTGLAVYALEIAAAVYLFRPDAAAWLRGNAVDPTAFD